VALEAVAAGAPVQAAIAELFVFARTTYTGDAAHMRTSAVRLRISHRQQALDKFLQLRGYGVNSPRISRIDRASPEIQREVSWNQMLFGGCRSMVRQLSRKTTL
jgi:hypothetical protein